MSPVFRQRGSAGISLYFVDVLLVLFFSFFKVLPVFLKKPLLSFSCRSSTNEVKNLLQSLPRTSEPREMLFEDRTRAHADHIGQGFERRTTAAVGVLKAVRAGDRYGAMRGQGRRHIQEEMFLNLPFLLSARGLLG